MTSSLLIRCPFCDGAPPLPTPELLVDHLAQAHAQRLRVEHSQFGDRHSFETWLNRVEESRQDSSSYIPSGEEELEEEQSGNPEYYLLCAHHSQDATKRRRVDRNGNFPLPSPVLTCPAFVHVKHGDMGQVDVAYCLDHITSSDEKRAEMPQSTTSIGQKRGSSCMSMDCSSTPAPLPSTSTAMDTVPSIVSSTVVESEDVDFSPINEFISTKLDSTALKLKNLTKVLAQLAVDIGACERRTQPVYA
ncbi:hypothetical protein PENTCL1PPCAC_10674 [Pristionchus entomophagus]|uniref:Uncharacterized protein n=1 Tax=Pristionchus entomophagus TaxID=358040 RepID=A0AAV5T4I0_9BILA|nr:hypothetical protein PENTCL1PPCAC_10674 [Pristionchus entomophagus]